MLKLPTVLLLIFAINFGDSSILRSPIIQSFHELERPNTDLASKWGQHIMDFLILIDINDAMTVVMQYIQDPEVIEFIQFLTSPKVPEIIKEFESIEEFKEAVDFLESKGYEAKYIINVVNSFMKIPPFEKQKVSRKNKGMAGFIEDIMAIIPGDKMKEVFENKLESSPEVAELFNTIISEEFVDIMKRMAKNPKFTAIKETLEGYGFDTKFMCDMVKEIFGDYYQGMFCE